MSILEKSIEIFNFSTLFNKLKPKIMRVPPLLKEKFKLLCNNLILIILIVVVSNIHSVFSQNYPPMVCV